MDKQVDVDIQGDPAAGAPVRARWFICDNGMTVADGTALIDPAGGPIEWQDSSPPAEQFGMVSVEIERALRRRRGS